MTVEKLLRIWKLAHRGFVHHEYEESLGEETWFEMEHRRSMVMLKPSVFSWARHKGLEGGRRSWLDRKVSMNCRNLPRQLFFGGSFELERLQSHS